MSYLNSKPPTVLNPTNLNERTKFPSGRNTLKETLKASNKFLNTQETKTNINVLIFIISINNCCFRRNLKKTPSKASHKEYHHMLNPLMIKQGLWLQMKINIRIKRQVFFLILRVLQKMK